MALDFATGISDSHFNAPVRWVACDPKLAANLLDEMLVLTATEMKGRCDKQGKPYFLHCTKVMHLLRSDDDELNCIAVGHDLIEDCKNVTYKRLTEMRFTERIVEGIRCMTKVPGEDKSEYKTKVKSNWDSIRVKMADLRHNMDLRRLKGVTEKDLLRIAEYAKFYQELNELYRKWS